MSSQTNPIDYKNLQELIFFEINKVRNDPKSYIPILEAQKELFKNDILYRDNQLPIQTYEGVAAFDEAIKFLEEQNAVTNLKLDEHPTKAATDLVNDIGPKGLISHEDSNGNFVSERIEKYTEWDKSCFECIDLGGRTAQEVLVNMLVDDGVRQREHRNNLFSTNYAFVGVGSGYHKEYGLFSVIVFVGGIREKGTLFYDYNNYKYNYPEQRLTTIIRLMILMRQITQSD